MSRLTTNETERSLRNSLKQNIKNNFGSVYNGKDSSVNILSEAVASELSFLRNVFTTEINQKEISNASGRLLEELAYNMYRITRVPARYSKIYYEDKNLHFYVEQGTFGDINSGNDITIPKGTVVSVGSSMDGEDIYYEIDEEYVLPKGNNFFYCSATASEAGSNHNVSEESLRFHNFTGYTSVNSDSLKVSNKNAVVNGNDSESDSILKFRIANWLTASTNLNIDLITLKSLTMPGVNEVRVIPSYYGIGTVGVIVFSSGREMTRSSLELVSNRLSEMQLPGRNIIATEGIKVYLDFDILVYIKKGINTFRKARIKDNIKREIFNLIKEKEFSNIISLNEISLIVQSNLNDNEIVGFSSKKNSNIFRNVYMRKADRFDLFPEEKRLVDDNTIILEQDESVRFGLVNIELEEDAR